MTNFICRTCGTQFAATPSPPAACPICDDERQYVGWNGQQWTTMAALQNDHHNLVKRLEPELVGIASCLTFAIGQRALLVQSPGGNVLWDCITLIDEATVLAIKALGGIRAIAISHPHYYSSMVEWSHAFNAPVYLHAADREHVMRPDPAIEFWSGDSKPLWDGMALYNCPGHFAGATILHWPAGAEGRGALLVGDILNVVSDRRYVSFMYSYPNLLPLPARTVRRIGEIVEPLAFDRIHGAWWDRVVAEDGKAAVQRSVARYIRAISE